MKKKWFGTWPAKCDYCKKDLQKTEYFVDGVTLAGCWALMCPTCFAYEGRGIGVGRGQKYNSKTLFKEE